MERKKAAECGTSRGENTPWNCTWLNALLSTTVVDTEWVTFPTSTCSSMLHPCKDSTASLGLGLLGAHMHLKTLAVQPWNHPIVLLLNRSTALSALGGHGHNFNHKPDLTNPFVVLKCGACVPHILLIPGSSEKDHDFWDGVARGKVAPGTCWKWQLKKADWSTGITLTVNVEDSEDTPSHHCVKGVCLFCDISL